MFLIHNIQELSIFGHKIFESYMSPKVSVILPFYNAEKTLARAMSSIENQTLTDFECILINNNSNDKSPDVARAFAQKDKRFKVITEPKQGVMHASNTGSSVARGQYIARMDADDWSYPGRLELQNNFLDQHPGYGAVAGLVEHVGHPINTAGFARYVEIINAIRSYEDIINRQFVESPIINPSAMWRSDIAEENGMYLQGDFPEDYEMWLRWIYNGVKICKIDHVVLKWHDSNTRLTRTHPIYRDKAFYLVKSYYLSKWLKKNNPFHPNVCVWGASRISRRRASLLEQYGIKIINYIDTKKTRQLDKNVIYYLDIPSPKEIFVLIYIKQINAKKEIIDFLLSRGFEEGKHFLLVS